MAWEKHRTKYAANCSWSQWGQFGGRALCLNTGVRVSISRPVYSSRVLHQADCRFPSFSPCSAHPALGGDLQVTVWRGVLTFTGCLILQNKYVFSHSFEGTMEEFYFPLSYTVSWVFLFLSRRSRVFYLLYRYIYSKIWDKDIFSPHKKPKIAVMGILATSPSAVPRLQPRRTEIASLRTQHPPFATGGLSPSISIKYHTPLTDGLLWTW